MSVQSTDICRLPRVEEKTGLGKTSIYEGVKAGWFPPPVRLMGRLVGWVEEEVDAWIEKRIAERDQAGPKRSRRRR